MVDWIVLLVLIPAIVVPVVLLYGFAGCSFDPRGAVPEPAAPDPPVILAATPLDRTTIRVTWTNPNVEPVRFEIERTPPFTAAPPPDPVSPFTDQALESGETYTYRVRAIRLADEEVSDFSEDATAVTYAEALNPSQNAGQNVQAVGDCVVQRIDPPALSRNGNLVQLVVTAGSDGSLRITRASLSEAAPAGDPFDSAGPPVAIEGPFDVPAGTSIELPPRSFFVDPSKSLLVAFDIGTPGQTRTTPHVNTDAFLNQSGVNDPPIEQALTQDRSGFSPQLQQVWVITRIDVATEWRTS